MSTRRENRLRRPTGVLYLGVLAFLAGALFFSAWQVAAADKAGYEAVELKAEETGKIAGTLTLLGQIPRPEVVTIDKDIHCCGTCYEKDYLLVNKDNGPWELYDLSTDRSELKDRSTDSPRQLAEMKARWEQLVEEYGTGRKKKQKKSNKAKQKKKQSNTER